jgi:uncharacterized protein YjbJ (UPF0337 family)
MGIRDEAKNAAAALKGEAKQAGGKLTGNDELAAEGLAERGIAQANQDEEVARREGEGEEGEAPEEPPSMMHNVPGSEGR